MTSTPMPRPRTNAGWLAVILVAVVVLLPVGYMGAYYGMLQPLQIAFGNPLPVYRSDSERVRIALAPAHQLDRLIRPSYWGE